MDAVGLEDKFYFLFGTLSPHSEKTAVGLGKDTDLYIPIYP